MQFKVLQKVPKKVLTLLNVPKIVPKRVPFHQKSSQYSGIKGVPKKFKKKVQKIVLKKVPKKVQTLLKVPKIVPKKVLFLKKVPKKALFKALLAGRNLYAYEYQMEHQFHKFSICLSHVIPALECILFPRLCFQ